MTENTNAKEGDGHSQGDTNQGVQSETSSLIGKANEAAERLEKANKERTELLRREEELEARRRLGGQTSGNNVPVKKEETPSEYMKRVMSGGLNEKATED